MSGVERGTRAGFEALVLRADGAEVEVVPARGGLVTRFTVDDDEVLFLDESTLADSSKSVRGGIPLLFPNAGPLPEGRWQHGALPQHGFARQQAFGVERAGLVGGTPTAELLLRTNAQTAPAYPFELDLALTVSLRAHVLTLQWRIANLGAQPAPWHFGLHPYFRVANKSLASVHTRATRVWNNVSKREEPFVAPRFDAGEVDLHLLDHGSPTARLRRGDGTSVHVEASAHFSTWVLWTLPARDFICLEPWTAPIGALATGQGALHLAPKSVEVATVSFAVTKP